MTVGRRTAAANEDVVEREFQNPLYQLEDFASGSTNLNSPIPIQENIYESLYTDTNIYCELPNEENYKDIDGYYSVPRSLGNGWRQCNGEVKGEAESEAIYDLPPDVMKDSSYYENCLSTIGSADLKLHPQALPY